MDEELRESLESLAAQHQERLAGLRRMQEELREVSAGARTRDGMVSVEVSANGRLRDIRFDPRVYDRLSPQRLAHTIMKLIGEATEEVVGQLAEITAPFVPDGLVQGLTEGDFSGLMPDAPSMLDREDPPRSR
jgi:DNA-binding protein YbaB